MQESTGVQSAKRHSGRYGDIKGLILVHVASFPWLAATVSQAPPHISPHPAGSSIYQKCDYLAPSSKTVTKGAMPAYVGGWPAGQPGQEEGRNLGV